MKTFALTPLDAWFFRDGRPYNEKEANQSDVASLFPPPARTLSGALRAALAEANGGWNGETNRLFGKDSHDLGVLQFTCPFLIKKSEKDKEDIALWPLPRHVLGRVDGGKWTPQAFLRPADSTTATDAGNINLPVIAVAHGTKRDGLKPAENAWISTAGLADLLSGEIPSSETIALAKEFWRHEPRVGLHRDEEKRTTGEGALYSPAYVRLCKDVSLGIGIAGLPPAMHPPESILPLGGESRLAHCEEWTGAPLPAAPVLTSSDGLIAFTVTLLTPGCFKEPPLPGATIVSACVGKPLSIGGWDSLQRAPLPLEPFAPAGSVWFCTAPAADFAALHALHGTHLGRHAAHGFGHIIIGHWPHTSL